MPIKASALDFVATTDHGSEPQCFFPPTLVVSLTACAARRSIPLTFKFTVMRRGIASSRPQHKPFNSRVPSRARSAVPFGRRRA